MTIFEGNRVSNDKNEYNLCYKKYGTGCISIKQLFREENDIFQQKKKKKKRGKIVIVRNDHFWWKKWAS